MFLLLFFIGLGSSSILASDSFQNSAAPETKSRTFSMMDSLTDTSGEESASKKLKSHHETLLPTSQTQPSTSSLPMQEMQGETLPSSNLSDKLEIPFPNAPIEVLLSTLDQIQVPFQAVEGKLITPLQNYLHNYQDPSKTIPPLREALTSLQKEAKLLSPTSLQDLIKECHDFLISSVCNPVLVQNKDKNTHMTPKAWQLLLSTRALTNCIASDKDYYESTQKATLDAFVKFIQFHQITLEPQTTLLHTLLKDDNNLLEGLRLHTDLTTKHLLLDALQAHPFFQSVLPKIITSANFYYTEALKIFNHSTVGTAPQPAIEFHKIADRLYEIAQSHISAFPAQTLMNMISNKVALGKLVPEKKRSYYTQGKDLVIQHLTSTTQKYKTLSEDQKIELGELNDTVFGYLIHGIE